MKYSSWVSSNLQVITRNGEEWSCRCPFSQNHRNGDRTSSCSVNVRKGVFYCHGCGEKGTLQTLAAMFKRPLTVTSPQPSELLRRINELKATTEQVQTLPEAWLAQFASDKGWRYWESRGLHRQTIVEFKLGYERSSHSAIIPMRSMRGDLIGVIRRRLSERAKPRYLYPQGFRKSEHLWGAFKAKDHERIAVVEGAVDSLALWDCGIPAVAILGSRLSTHQANLLRKLGCRTIVVMTDRDPAGRMAARSIRELAYGLNVAIGTYKKAWDGKDPAELTPMQRKVMFEEAFTVAVG